MINIEEFKQALLLIKKDCKKIQDSTDCYGCPCGTDENKCLLKEDYPCNWEITAPKTIIRIMHNNPKKA